MERSKVPFDPQDSLSQENDSLKTPHLDFQKAVLQRYIWFEKNLGIL